MAPRNPLGRRHRGVFPFPQASLRSRRATLRCVDRRSQIGVRRPQRFARGLVLIVTFDLSGILPRIPSCFDNGRRFSSLSAPGFLSVRASGGGVGGVLSVLHQE